MGFHAKFYYLFIKSHMRCAGTLPKRANWATGHGGWPDGLAHLVSAALNLDVGGCFEADSVGDEHDKQGSPIHFA